MARPVGGPHGHPRPEVLHSYVTFGRGDAVPCGEADGAVEALTRATAALPETGAWHHLGRLYLAMAAARG